MHVNAIGPHLSVTKGLKLINSLLVLLLTRNTSTQRDEHNSRNRVLDTQCTAKVRCNVTNYRSDNTNAKYADYETEVTTGNICNKIMIVAQFTPVINR
uniref:Secreted protein n=1 Tax=Bracon brevicornis TaxID=1563983 RepID=A0A6V7KQ09_9HYME